MRFPKSMILLLPVILAICASACVRETNIPTGKEIIVKGTTFSFDKLTYPSPENVFPVYKIVPGDMLDVLFQVSSWEESGTFRLAVDHTVSVKFVNAPNLNETQNVRPDGKITLPYIGDIYVVGKTIPDITDELKRSYKGILKQPIIVYVTVPEFSSQIRELKKDLHTASRGLSRLVTVRPDGNCTFPIVGDVFVANKTFAEVKSVLDTKYNDFLPGLHVDLFLEKHAGSIVYVTGRVNQPGAYGITKPITVLEAITLAGGHLTDANIGKVVLFRRKGQDHVAVVVDLQSAVLPTYCADLYYLRPDDIVYVPRKKLADQAEIMRDVMQILMFRGWSVTMGADFIEGGIFDDNGVRR